MHIHAPDCKLCCDGCHTEKLNESYGQATWFKELLLRPILLFYARYVLLSTQISISTGNYLRLGTATYSQHTAGAFILYWETLYIVIAGSLIVKVSGQAPCQCWCTRRSRLSVQILNCQKYGRTGKDRQGPPPQINVGPFF